MEILLKYFYKKNELFRKSDVGLGFCASNPTKPWFSSIYSYSICSPKPEGKCNIPTSGCRVPPKEPPVILPPCVPDETVKDRFCIVHTPDDQGVFVFADNSFFSGLWQRDSLPGSCSAVCHWMHEAPQVTLHPRRGNPPPSFAAHIKDYRIVDSPSPSLKKVNSNSLFCTTHGFHCLHLGLKSFPSVDRMQPQLSDRQQPPIIQLLTVKHLRTQNPS